MRVIKDLKQFVLQGNAIDLGVAIAIATTLVTLVKAAVEDLFTPLIAAMGGKTDFSALTFTINDSTFKYGDFVNNAILFLVIVGVAFFFVVRPVNAMRARHLNDPLEDPSIRVCKECLSEVPVKSTRCKFCTATV